MTEGPLVVPPYAELLICCYMWHDNTMVQLVCSMHRDGAGLAGKYNQVKANSYLEDKTA